MKRFLLALFGLLASAGAVEAQLTDAQMIERALLAAPARARENAAVIKWNPDHTYTEIKAGAGTLVCYDHSGAAGEAPFSMQCTHPGNLPRVAAELPVRGAGEWRRRHLLNQLVAEAEAERHARSMPVYGSPWIGFSGADQASARMHMTIATPDGNHGFDRRDPRERPRRWHMDHGRRHASRPSHDPMR